MVNDHMEPQELRRRIINDGAFDHAAFEQAEALVLEEFTLAKLESSVAMLQRFVTEPIEKNHLSRYHNAAYGAGIFTLRQMIVVGSGPIDRLWGAGVKGRERTQEALASFIPEIPFNEAPSPYLAARLYATINDVPARKWIDEYNAIQHKTTPDEAAAQYAKEFALGYILLNNGSALPSDMQLIAELD